MGERTQINFLVDQEQKSKWETAVDDHSQAKNLSELIRLAVSREIADGNQSNSTAIEDEAFDDMREMIYSEVVDPLQKIENELELLSNQIDALQREGVAADSNFDLQKAVFETLPTPPEDSNPESSEPHHFNRGEIALTADEISDRLGADRDDVTDVLEQLDDIMSVVRSGHSEQTKRWYKTTESQ